MERIAIIGSRHFPDLGIVSRYVQSLPERAVVITGGHPVVGMRDSKARPTEGVDAAAYGAALLYAHTPVLVVANWNAHGKTAGHVRNPIIVDLADRVVAFWVDMSPGTKGGIEYARKIGKPLEIYGGNGERWE